MVCFREISWEAVTTRKYETNYHRNLLIFKLGGSNFFQVCWGKELVNHAADELDGPQHFTDVQDGFARYTRGTSCNRYNSIKKCVKGAKLR